MKLIDLLTIPYVPRWTFGEDIASVHEKAGKTGTRTASQAVSYACETIAALIVQKFDNVDLLVSSREEYIHAGRSVARNLQGKTGKTVKVFISHVQEDAEEIKRLVKVLKKIGGRDIEILKLGDSAGVTFEKEFLSAIESADAYVVVVGFALNNSSSQQQEIEQLLRMNLRSAKPKTIIPVVLEKGEDAFIRSRLADYQAVFLDRPNWPEEQIYPLLRRVLNVSEVNEISSEDTVQQEKRGRSIVSSTTDIFIAYSRSDHAVAERLAMFLQKQGWSVFIDRNTHVGRRWQREIEKQLQAAKAVVVLWSSISRDSDYVLEQAEYGKRRNILFPAFIEKVELPYGFGRIHTVDLIKWSGSGDKKGLSDLLTPLQQHLNSPVAGQTFRDKLKTGGEGPLMAMIPAGRFLMGSPLDEPERRDTEGPQHEVQMAKPLAMGVYPVTFDDYDLFCKNTSRKEPGDGGWGREKRPIINVSWHDAQDYCTWLREQTRRDYRLPSEAEWEYACRAGTQTPYYTGKKITKEQANFAGNVGKTTPVGSYPPNAFDLYDMHGNVWEWCQDAWHENYHHAPSDGSSWSDDGSEYRVLRGGSWNSSPSFARASVRGYSHPGYRNSDIGFRVLCSSPIE